MTLAEQKEHSALTQPELFGRIGDICNAVTASLSAKELLAISLQKIMDLFGAQRGSIFILSEKNTKELILKIAFGMKHQEQERMVKRLGEGVVGKVAEIKKPIVVEDISSDDRFKDYKPRQSYQSHSFICAPLLVKDKLIGVINLTDKERGQRFSKSELQLLDFISSQVALNYKRTQLYQKFKDMVKESKTLKDELGKSTKVTDSLKQKVVIQEKLASIGKLAGGIAHELNNPLDGVLRYVNLSLEQLSEDDVIHGYLLEVKQGLNRMVNIIRSLLACSRNSVPTMQKIDVHMAIEEAISGVNPELYNKNIKLKKNFAKKIPKISDLGVERIASNLLRNSIDAIDGQGTIKVTTKSTHLYFILEVEDTGHGIPAKLVENIFEPFYTTKEIDKGCGLGLTIVSEIVKAYNGKIDIETQPEKGTKFTITIPLYQHTYE